MKRSKLFPTLCLAGSILLTPAANAAGMIVIDPIMPMPPRIAPIVRPTPVLPGHPTPRPTPTPRRPILKGGVVFGLRLQGEEVKVEITDQVAKTYIIQTFANDTDQQLAGTYLFPLPEDTTFSSFSLHIDGKPVEGKILEANEARQQYEAIVRRMVDPGLLEYADYKTVRARIFPIPAHGTKKVELEYTQLLKADNGLLKYKFPLKTESDSEATAAEEIKIDVKLASKQNLKTIWSPSHAIASTRTNDHNAKIAFTAQDVTLDKDFLLYYSVSDKDIAANLLTHKDSGEDGYYLLTLNPPVESKQAVGKDVVIVADTSGSMQGDRMVQNKKALKYIVNALSPTDRFSIVEFNTDVEMFKSNVVTATPENKKQALSFVEDLEARGGTNIGDALKTATTMLDQTSDRPAYLVLMTDGEPTVGETSVPGLLKTVTSKRDIRVFDFGIGYDINTKLLNRLAEDHHGAAQYVEPDESIETALSSFYEKIKSPVLSNVKIAYEGVQVKDIYPRAVKDIFAGSQVLLLGRYKAGGAGTVKLTGTVNGVPKAYSFPLTFANAEAGHTYLPRVWAMRRIGHLTDVAQENGNSREVVDEILSLSKKYGIISAYSSYLVTEPDTMPMNGTRPRAVPMMMRSSGPGLVPPPPVVSLTTSVMPMANFGGTTGVHGTLARRGAIAGAGSIADKGRFYNAPRSFEIVDERPVSRMRDVDFKEAMLQAAAAPVAGKDAVKKAKQLDSLKNSIAAANSDAEVKSVEDKVFVFKNGFWTDTTVSSAMKTQTITFGTKEYFDLLKLPGISKYLAVGHQVIFNYKGQTYRIVFKQDA